MMVCETVLSLDVELEVPRLRVRVYACGAGRMFVARAGGGEG